MGARGHPRTGFLGRQTCCPSTPSPPQPCTPQRPQRRAPLLAMPSAAARRRAPRGHSRLGPGYIGPSRPGAAGGPRVRGRPVCPRFHHHAAQAGQGPPSCSLTAPPPTPPPPAPPVLPKASGLVIPGSAEPDLGRMAGGLQRWVAPPPMQRCVGLQSTAGATCLLNQPSRSQPGLRPSAARQDAADCPRLPLAAPLRQPLASRPGGGPRPRLPRPRGNPPASLPRLPTPSSGKLA